jgi:hypothetical protein
MSLMSDRGALPPEMPTELTVDTPCRKCGYNLRGLSTQSRCPECWCAVGLSIVGDLLKFADPLWVRTLARGGNFILGGIVLIVLAMIGVIISSANRHLGGAGIIAQFVVILGNFLIVVGFWLITVPDPSGIGEDIYGTARQIIRFTLIFGVVNSILSFANQSAVFSPPVHVALQILGVVAAIVGIIAQLHYYGKLAERIPNEKLANRANFLKVVLPSSYIVIVLFSLVATRGLNRRRVASSGVAALGCFGGIVGLMVLVFAMMYLFLIIRLTRRFTEQARIAERTWALHAPGGETSA